MPDKKPPDNEIIKALECCTVGTYACGDDCPCFHSKSNLKVTSCRFELLGEALDLINRLQAENERLKDLYEKSAYEREMFLNELTDAKAENERLEKIRQEQGKRIDDLRGVKYEQIEVIHNLKQELITAKAEAYKEFAERLKENLIEKSIVYMAIDNLLKELVNEEN